jgi:hypothetical protein
MKDNYKGLKIKLSPPKYRNKERFAYMPTIVQNLQNKDYYLIWLRNYLQDSGGCKKYKFINEK